MPRWLLLSFNNDDNTNTLRSRLLFSYWSHILHYLSYRVVLFKHDYRDSGVLWRRILMYNPRYDNRTLSHIDKFLLTRILVRR